MLNKFDVSYKFRGFDEKTGKPKTFNESIVVEAVNFSDAETIATGETNEETQIKSIKRVSFSDVLRTGIEDDKWFKCRISLISVDEISGKEKKIKFPILVQGDTVEAATNLIIESFKGTVSDYYIESVNSSKIVDFIQLENVEIKEK